MIVKYKGFAPQIHESCFIAPSADIIGKVQVGENASIWFNAVLRGDIAAIKVGKNTNIQDGCIIHGDTGIDTILGNGVVVGHKAILHGCVIQHNCLIGMGATILNNVKIGENCIIGANTLVTSGKIIPPNSLVLGNPGKVIRELTQEEIQSITQNVNTYVEYGRLYKQEVNA